MAMDIFGKLDDLYDILEKKAQGKSTWNLNTNVLTTKHLMEQQQFSSIVSKQDFFLLGQSFSGLDRSSEKL